MVKRLALFLVGFFIIVPVFFYIITYSYSESVVLSDKKVIYELPYVGMLPDNPLYIVKQIRDKIIEFTIRDYQKKADYYLLLADKQIGIAIQMNKKGKTKQAITYLKNGETLMEKIYSLLTNSKKQGVAFHESFIYRLKQSNVKHREVIESFMKDLPSGNEQIIKEIADINEEIRKKLEKM